MKPAEVDAFALAFVAEHPGTTARDLAAALGSPMCRSRERAQANAALKRLGDRGAIEADGYPQPAALDSGRARGAEAIAETPEARTWLVPGRPAPRVACTARKRADRRSERSASQR